MMYIIVMNKLVKYFNCLVLVSVIFFCQKNDVLSKENLPEAITWNSYLKEITFGDDIISDGSSLLDLETPYRALDASIVPITVNVKKKQDSDYFIKTLTLVVDENPSPLVSKFHFTPKTGNASLTTRIRIDKYTYVRAIAEMNNGNKFMVSKFVKAAGGCSAPSLADMDAVMARLGKMKMKFIKTGSKGSINKAEFLISHPNYSGLQFNQLTRSEIPAHFINYLRIEQDGQLIIEANPDISISEDPSFMFHYVDSGGPLRVKIEDSHGQEFTKEFPLSEVLSSNNP